MATKVEAIAVVTAVAMEDSKVAGAAVATVASTAASSAGVLGARSAARSGTTH